DAGTPRRAGTELPFPRGARAGRQFARRARARKEPWLRGRGRTDPARGALRRPRARPTGGGRGDRAARREPGRRGGDDRVRGRRAGLLPPTVGEVTLLGSRVTGVRTDVGFIFQRDALLPWRTVRENVELPLRFRGERDPARAKEWIVRVGLGPFIDNYPHELSGGMRKRAQLAQSLVRDPSVLLMDEPFSALDVQTRNLMENELLNLWGASGKTVLFITHDLEEAIALSGEIVVMTAGPGTI